MSRTWKDSRDLGTKFGRNQAKKAKRAKKEARKHQRETERKTYAEEPAMAFEDNKR